MSLKGCLRNNEPFGLFAVPQSEVVRVHVSSGTTGRPTVVGDTRHGIDLWSEVIARTLTAAGVNISAFSIAGTAEYGLARLIVSKPEEAEKVLREKNFSVHLTDVIGLVVPDEPGGLRRALKILSDEGISVEYMYAFALGDRATVITSTETMQRTIAALLQHKMELTRASEIYEL